MLSELLAGLIESLPEDAYPGEDNAEVVLDMLVGSIRPVVEAAGGESAHSATTLIADAAIGSPPAGCSVGAPCTGPAGWTDDAPEPAAVLTVLDAKQRPCAY